MKKIIWSFLFLFITFNIYCISIEKNSVEPMTYYSQKTNINKIFKDKKLIFITTWCPQCEKKIKEIEEIGIEENYIFIFGNYGSDNIEKVSQFLKLHPKLKYVFFDKDNMLKKQFSVKTVPFEVKL